jgi:hypothetical protein
MSATIHRIETARIKRAARLVNAEPDTRCAECGEVIEERGPTDSKTGRDWHLSCWLRLEGLAP